MMPLTYQSRKPLRLIQPPPVLVLMHGVGSDESDLLGLAQSLDPRFYVISLRAPRTYGSVGGSGGYSWFDLVWSETGVTGDLDQALESLRRVQQMVEDLPQMDPILTGSPVYVMGFSQGAMMSLLLSLRYPQQVQGAVILSGRWPMGLTVDPSPELEQLPVLVVHGTQDPILTIEQGREIRQRLEALPVALTYREYEMGHTINPDSLMQVCSWLQAHLDRSGGTVG